MYKYILRRVLVAIPTLLGVTIVTFVLMKSLPGNPVEAMIGERADPQVVEEIRAQLGMDRHVVVQYTGYLWLLCRGELGRSYFTNVPVARSLMQKFPNTLRLAVAAMAVAVAIGLVLGVVSAVKRDSLADRFSTIVASLGISTPVFWLGLILIIVFANWLGWLPAGGMGDGRLSFLVLPAIALGTRSAAYIARITRSAMIEVLSQDYIRTARAKGLSTLRVNLRHALRNALIPIVTLVGVDFGSYLNGAVLTETIFRWDGIGRYAMDGIAGRDYPVILGTVLFGAAVFVVVNLMVDVSYAWLDPKVRRR